MAVAAAVVEGESPVVLRVELGGLGREDAVAWVHAWCARSLAVAPQQQQQQQQQQEERASGSSPVTSTRPFGGSSSATTAYQRAAQARPGLPDPSVLSLPVKVAALTPDGARLVCQGMGPAFLDLDIQAAGEGSRLVVRQRLGEQDLGRHSASIKGLARDTERQVLEKLRADLGRTLPHPPPPASAAAAAASAAAVGGGSKAAAVASAAASSRGPPPGATDVQDESGAGGMKEMEDEGDFKALLERLGLAEALGLDEALGLGDSSTDEGDGGEMSAAEREARAQRQAAWAAPDSPFAKKAAEAYEAFVQGQAEGSDGEGSGGAAEAMKGLGQALLEEVQAAAATPDDVRAMFEQGTGMMRCIMGVGWVEGKRRG